jgi:murein L,D-transpeptidase YcbB/YkuD
MVEKVKSITQRALAGRYIFTRVRRGQLTYAQLAEVVRAYQLEVGIPADGMPGPATLDRATQTLIEKGKR